MSQPVKLSDALVLDARLAGEVLERSIADQVEFWARLGRAIEPLLQGTQAMALCRNASARPLSACLDSVDSPEGRDRVATFLQTRPYPHYEPSTDSPGLLVRIEADGRRTVGRFANADDLRTPFREVADFVTGRCVRLKPPVLRWLEPLLP